MRKANHHLLLRNGIFQIQVRRRGKLSNKSTRTKDVIEARKIRDAYLEEIRRQDIQLAQAREGFFSLERAIQLRDQLKALQPLTPEREAVEGQIRSEAEDIALGEKALAVFHQFEEAKPFTNYSHQDFLNIVRSKLTPLEAFRNKWLESINNRKTMLDYRRGLDVLMEDFKYAEEINFQHAKVWLRQTPEKKGVKPQTTRKWVSGYKSFWAYMGLEEKSPWAGQQIRSKDKKAYLCWKISEVRLLLERAKKQNSQPWLFHAINIAAHTGARLEAVCDLVEYHQDWDAIQFPKKKRETMDRIVACHANVRESVLWWLDKSNERPLNAKQMSRGFGRFKKKQGFASDRLVFHSFRHTVVKYLKNVGCRTSIIAGVVGHENRAFTVSSRGYGRGTTPASISRPWIDQIDYNAPDWQELNQDPLDLDLLLQFSEAEIGEAV